MSNKQYKDHTFVILAFGKSPYLEECVNSLKKQNLESKILISTSTPNINISHVAKEYDIPIYINKNSKGLASDWNYALSLARTKYVTLAHQDDIYSENYLEIMLSGLDKHKHFLIKFSNYAELLNKKNNGHVIRKNTLNLIIKRVIIFFAFLFNEELKTKKQKLNFLRFGSPIPCPSVLYNRSLLGGFKFNDNFLINVDWIAWINLANKKGAFIKTNEKLLLHRIHEGSETSRGISTSKRLDEDTYCFMLLWPNFIANLLQKFYKISYYSNTSK